MSGQDALGLVEASIKDLRQALDSGSLTGVELVSLYLHRIGKYDTRGPSFNSICILNQHVFEEAQAFHDRRATGLPPRPLEGIPFTVKDSFSVKGMTVAAGSPAFANLVAPSDAAIVQLLRSAGALVLGRTNMPAMADGGSRRGRTGRAESPYDPAYSTTAYAAGSSNGSGTATASSFASFGLASETVSSPPAASGRCTRRATASCRTRAPSPTCSPCSPSSWPTIPRPPRRGRTSGGSSRSSRFPRSPPCEPRDFGALQDPHALAGKRVAVPRCFVGVEGAEPATVCSPAVRALWEQARADLEALGATVLETGFPLFEQYTAKDFPGQSANVPGMTEEWVGVERCQMIALAWDDFLRANGDEAINTLTAVSDPDTIKPLVAPMDDPKMHTEAQNQVRYSEMLEAVRTLPGAGDALRALEAMRKGLG
ncbi:glu asp-tRNA amidotransferase subunit a [Botryosphaeria dothidea]|uniref:Glu asp-tRNA amidotransferase subunit a n=1 Tax=Botryosphaeria dothidea TaxID=55169 RepID=A0A8H4MZN6_9PEZI|nr:glu asp-tRNA amidotransferase subunit a [Botryosphaeria dothidea]